MSSERQCTICNGTLQKNGQPQLVDGKLRQFYRCDDCRQGGWTNTKQEGTAAHGRGPIFNGLHGRMANQIARNYAAKVRA